MLGTNIGSRRWALALVAAVAIAAVAMIQGALPAAAAACTYTLSSPTYSGAEGTNILIAVNRSGNSGSGCADEIVTLTLAGSGGTPATNPADFTGPTVIGLALGGSATSNTYTLPTVHNAGSNTAHTLTASISFQAPGPVGGDSITPTSSATVTITDIDASSYTFGAPSYTTSEGVGSFSVPVYRNGSTAGAASIDCTVTGGTATGGGVDYTFSPTPKTISFGTGVSSGFCTFLITDDAITESDETVILGLGSPTGGLVAGSYTATTVTIQDNDGPGTVQFTASTFTVNEADGTASLTVSRTGGGSGAASVFCSTVAGGTATAGADYTIVTNQALNWGSGDTTTKTCLIGILQDTSQESPETVVVQLSGASGASLGAQSTATLTINDDDGTGTIQFGATVFNVNEQDGSATITITRSGGSGAVGITCSTTTGGTATAGADYTVTNQVVSFTAGQTTATCSIPIVNDLLSEGTETVALVLSSPTGGATLGSPSTATLNILDNEATVATISTISPNVGPVGGGQVVTITGTNLTNASSVVIGGVACAINAALGSSTQVVCTTGTQAAGTYNVTVGTPVGSPTLTAGYTYSAGPVVTGFDVNTAPASGTPITYVTVYGSGLSNPISVKFGGTAATIISSSDTAIQVITPAHSAGIVDVIVTTAAGVSPNTAADDFTFTGTLIPSVTSVSPTSGQAGTTVVITGSGFTGASSVTFGGVSASFNVNSDTQITATAPSGMPAGQLDIRVSNSGGTSANVAGDNFTNTASAQTYVHTLYFRWTLVSWNGQDGISISTALSGSGAGTNNVASIVTAIWLFDPVTQTYKGWFPTGAGIPGAVDITTLRKGSVYWIAINASGSTNWTIVLG